MDYFAKINELTLSKSSLIAKANKLIEENNFGDELTSVQNEIKNVQSQIEQVTAVAAASEGAAVPSSPDTREVNDKKPLHLFNNLGEQLKAVYNFAKTGVKDERLDKINNAVMGAESKSGADGGFAVQEDFAGSILESAASAGEILSRVNTYTLGANSNSVRWLRVDEDDISSSVYGGVRMYWAAEGYGVQSSKPKFAETKIDLEKMMGFAYATDELLSDAVFMSSFFGKSFTLASRRLLEESIISGDGKGKPLGFLNSGALIKIEKESNQAASTIKTENILKMWNRMHIENRSGTVWLAHPDAEEELQKLTFNGDSIWMPEGGISASPYQRILGRPVIYNDCCSPIGTVGDISLVDFTKYILVKKGTAKQDWSMHVEFLTDQMCFRIILRCNGAPEIDKPLKIKNSTKTRSPFVTLADRK